MARREGPARQPGRPQMDGAGSSVPDDLLDALWHALREKLHSELTLKEIAERAGTSPEMIRYYFGGKDGLIMALLKQTSERFVACMDRLDQEILEEEGSPVARILRELFTFYLEERHVTRVSLSEFQKAESRIYEDFLAKRADVVIGRIHAMLEQLVAAGRYDPGMDVRKAALTIMTMVTGPVTFLSVLPDRWVSERDLRDEGWAAWLAELIDGQWACGPDGTQGAG